MEIFKRISFVWIIIALLVVWGVFALIGDDEEAEIETYENAALGIRFNFPDTYRIESRELGDGKNGHLSIVLVDKDFIPVEGGEGPPTINFDIYQSPAEPDALTWVNSNPFSNFALSDGKYEERGISGRPAVAYKSDGLYATDNIVVMNRDYILHVSSGYIAEDDEIRNHFKDVLRSLELY
jgi:hypothetical protein